METSRSGIRRLTGFIVDDTYDPSIYLGPVWLMYDRTTDLETEGDVYQLESQFKVIDAEGYDGEPVSNVTFEEKTTERYSTDIQELNTQLDDKLAGVPAGDPRRSRRADRRGSHRWGLGPATSATVRAPARSPPFSALSESRTRLRTGG